MKEGFPLLECVIGTMIVSVIALLIARTKLFPSVV